MHASCPASNTSTGSSVKRIASVVCVAAMLISFSGCALLANVMYVMGANQIPPEFEGLEESKVAIVTVTESSDYSDDISARQLSRMVGDLLLKEVDEISLVREDEIAKWRDTNGWDSADFVSIGRGVKADKVLGIELTNLRLRDGATLFRGRADVQISVIDVPSGAVVYRRSVEEFTYPMNAGQSSSETSESKFRRLYLGMLSKQIGRSFYPWDMTEDFANDGIIASQ